MVTVLAYLPAMRGEFVWDDGRYVVENQMLTSWSGLWQIWFDPAAYTMQFYPVTYTTLWIDHQIGQLDPLGYHVVNVVVHALNGLLVWLLLRRLHVPGALLAGFVFALHPVHVESVAWVTERKNVLSCLFFVLALGSWISFSRTGRWTRYGLSLLWFSLGLLSKTIVVTLPAVLVLWIWWQVPRERVKRELIGLVPMTLIGLSFARLTMWLEHRNTSGTDYGLSIIDSTIIAGRALWFYTWKLVWPLELMSIYPRWTIDATSVVQYVPAALFVGIVVLLWTQRRRIGKAPLVAILFFALTHGPTLSYLDFGFLGHSFVSDHFQYIPSIALIGLLVGVATLAVRRLAGTRPWVGPVAASVLVATFATLTWRQSAVFATVESFWAHNAEGNPTHSAFGSLSDVARAEGDLDRAEDLARRSIAVRDNARGHFRLALIHIERNELDLAIAELIVAREVNAQRDKVLDMDFRVYSNLAALYWRQGKYDVCVEAYRKALAEVPGDAATQKWLSRAEQRLARSRPPAEDE